LDHFNRVFCLEVRGDFACFTRPEMKVERVSYDVPTPSAVRAIFEAHFLEACDTLARPKNRGAQPDSMDLGQTKRSRIGYE